MRDLGPIMMRSDLSQLSLRNLFFIQCLISIRKLMKVVWVKVEMVLVEM